MLFRTGRCSTVLVEVSNEASTHHVARAGTYTIRDGKNTNGRKEWISENEKHAIWHDGDTWNIGWVSNRGTDRCGIKSSSTSLQLPRYSGKWKYYDGDEWVKSNDVQVKTGTSEGSM